MRSWMKKGECFRTTENGLQYICENMPPLSSSLHRVQSEVAVKKSSLRIPLLGKQVQIPTATFSRKSRSCMKLWRNFLVAGIFLTLFNPAFSQPIDNNDNGGKQKY